MMQQTTVQETSESDEARLPGPFEMMLGIVDRIVAAGTQDSATGLLSAGPWREQAAAALTSGDGSVAAVLLVDVDAFKEVNDEQGHLVGDLVVQAVARAIQYEVRQIDRVGRVGGDEFALLLRDVRDVESAALVAERIRARIAGLRLEMVSERGPVVVRPVTVSIGGVVVAVRQDRSVGAAVLAAAYGLADRLLYTAKASGRDTVRVAYADEPDAVTARAGGVPASSGRSGSPRGSAVWPDAARGVLP